MGLVICSYGVGNSLRAGESLEVDIEPVEDVGGCSYSTLGHLWIVDCGFQQVRASGVLFSTNR